LSGRIVSVWNPDGFFLPLKTLKSLS